MIYGIGVDLIEIARIEAAYARFGERFARRILTDRELERYHARRARSDIRGIAFLATRFAAKEAISKALGLGMRTPMTWRAVEVVNDPSGRPLAFASGELRAFMQRRRLRLHVSLTDERSMATAYAIAEVEGSQ
ncbi:MAG TPA: holo-ACP synthase [Burkholderiaceae bacterium]|jgi:holo-[acyl-carrier protein] synthase|nr:holo-ACP synthase [Burkholderiaceae bacterium]